MLSGQALGMLANNQEIIKPLIWGMHTDVHIQMQQPHPMNSELTQNETLYLINLKITNYIV